MRFVVLSAIAAVLAAGCRDSGTAESAPSEVAPESSQVESTSVEPDVAAGTPCLDVNSALVLDAVAGIDPDFQWSVSGAPESVGPDCPELLGVTAVGGASAAAPEHVLFFHDGEYLGTATAEPYAFSYISGVSGDTVSVEYKWLAGDEPFCCPQGGPVTITYTWDGSTVVMNETLPQEVTG